MKMLRKALFCFVLFCSVITPTASTSVRTTVQYIHWSWTGRNSKSKSKREQEGKTESALYGWHRQPLNSSGDTERYSIVKCEEGKDMEKRGERGQYASDVR